MSVRSPSEYFIKYLVSQNKHDENTILRVLEDFGLDGISSHYVKKVRRLMEPIPDVAETLDDPETQEWLRREGILDLWFPRDFVQEAYSILGKPDVRSQLERLLLSPLHVEEVVRRINGHFKIKLTPDGVLSFKHYFWDKSLLTMEEWVDYLDGRGDSEVKCTVLMASKDMAQVVVPWVTGLAGPPPNLNSGTVARRTRDVAFLKILEIERQPATLAHSKMLKNYADTIKIMEGEMRQSDMALKDVLRAFEKFRLRKDVPAVPSIADVAGPNYSRPGERKTAEPFMRENYFPEDDDGGQDGSEDDS